MKLYNHLSCSSSFFEYRTLLVTLKVQISRSWVLPDLDNKDLHKKPLYYLENKQNLFRLHVHVKHSFYFFNGGGKILNPLCVTLIDFCPIIKRNPKLLKREISFSEREREREMASAFTYTIFTLTCCTDRKSEKMREI